MIKKSIVLIAAIVIIVAAGALVFANYGNHANSTNSIQGNQQNLSANSTSDNKSNSNNISDSNPKSTDNTKIHVKIIPAQAKKIAQEHNEIAGDIAGTPKLHNDNGRYIYTVPFIHKKTGKTVGSIDIDAQTGESLGGWGDLPGDVPP